MKLLKSDNFLKLLSLIIAIGLWFYVVQVHNPDIEKTFRNVPVVFAQKNALEARDLILLNDKDLEIDIEIKGNRKNVMNLSSSDITVIADVGAIEKTGTHTVVTTVVLPYGNLEVINKRPSTLNVEVDDLVTETFKLKINPIGDLAEGCEIDSIKSSLETIEVTGAKTILGGIDSVVVDLDVTGADSDISESIVPKIYDSNGKEISTSYVKFSVENIDVKCKILKTKTVPLRPDYHPQSTTDGYIYHYNDEDMPSIRIQGPTDIIDNITFVETTPIISLNEEGETEVTLRLPENVISLDGDTFMVKGIKRPTKNN